MRTIRVLVLIFMLSVCAAAVSGGSLDGPTQTIEIHAHRFAFVPSEITIKKGETVRVRLISDDVTHSLVIKDLEINQPVSKSHPVEFTLAPTKAGDFQGRCGHYCGSGHGMMVFTVHATGD